MAFDMSKLAGIAKQLKEDTASQGGGGGEWPNTVFLPEGVHRGRFIIDPAEELYLKYNSYGYFAKGIRDPEDYPDQLPAHFHNRLSELATELATDYLKFGRKRKTNFLVYFWLQETDSPSEDWKANNLYCLLCDWRFEAAFSSMINSLMKDAPEKLLASLRPEQKGPIIEINYVRGNQGRCSVSATFSEGNPIVHLTEDEQKLSADDQKKAIDDKMGKLGYKPLQLSYIKPGFDQVRYDALVKSYEDELTQLRQQRNLKKAGEAGSGDAPQGSTQEAGNQQQTADAGQSQTQAQEQSQSTEGTQQNTAQANAGAATGSESTQQQTATDSVSQPTPETQTQSDAGTGEVKSNPFDKYRRQ